MEKFVFSSYVLLLFLSYTTTIVMDTIVEGQQMEKGIPQKEGVLNATSTSENKENQGSDEFQIGVLLKHLRLCILDKKTDKDLKIDEYIQVFQQLAKFFSMLGTVFGFVGSDVRSKAETLKSYRLGPHGDDYSTLEKMLEFETSTKKSANEAPQAFLGLHHSLIFVSKFLSKSLNLRMHEKVSAIAKKAYDATLAKQHPWLIRMTAHVAMHTLPTKSSLYLKVCSDKAECGPNSSSKVDDLVKEIALLTQYIYDTSEGIMTRKRFLH